MNNFTLFFLCKHRYTCVYEYKNILCDMKKREDEDEKGKRSRNISVLLTSGFIVSLSSLVTCNFFFTMSQVCWVKVNTWLIDFCILSGRSERLFVEGKQLPRPSPSSELGERAKDIKCNLRYPCSVTLCHDVISHCVLNESAPVHSKRLRAR